jgi:hypothetical protein
VESVAPRRNPQFFARFIAVLIAVALACWLAVGLRDTRLQAEGVALYQADPPRFQDGLNRLEDSGLLNMGDDRDILIAAANFSLGHRQLAFRQIRALLHDEPDNGAAWSLYAGWLDATDPAAAARARARAKALSGKFG